VPAARLNIAVRFEDAAALNRLDGFVEQGRTEIGTDVMVTLDAPVGPAAPELAWLLSDLRIPFEGHAQIAGRDYLIAGDGKQSSVVEAWAAMPAGMAAPPLRHDGSVDLARLRHWEWHCGFLDEVRGRMVGRVTGKNSVDVPAERIPYFKPSKELKDLVNGPSADSGKGET
jgi:hypothetical protein